MEQVFFAGKAYLKINSLVKKPLHEFMAVKLSGLCAPEGSYLYLRLANVQTYQNVRTLGEVNCLVNHSM